MKWTALTVLALVVLMAVAYRIVDVVVTEDYSREWTAKSSAEAAADGRLVARPAVLTPVVELDGRAVRVADAWVERTYHVEYVAFVVPRRVPDDGFRLLVRLAPEDTGAFEASLRTVTGGSWLTYNDSLRFSTTTGDYWITDVRPPFPQTLRLSTRQASRP